MSPRVSVVIPAYDEGKSIVPVLDRFFEAIESECEVVVVVDFAEDSTYPVLLDYAASEPRLRPLISDYGRGPAHAIRYGFDHAAADVVVVTMADGSDDPRQVDELARLVERGVVIAAASRYAPGGQQVGGPWTKRTLSRLAGRSLQAFVNVGTHDATNSFKAYDRNFVREVGISSRHGFEIGLELTAKAKRLRLPVAEIPTIWLERSVGISNFKVGAWVPKYLRWYRFAYGGKLTVAEIRAHDEQLGER
ncbi:Glycosyltransferase involved in cell wall bisynthesis [Jatrophihabitans endophyticus]|uniref:Glycosyltransferase involved in cell wall bisynthesis n=1 Tax=Jatrophihabitans endophyticus TaxID=1206085 RepID=A0A1M5CXD5_9ACTN|nr:glycosyltransferase family 2 protein [Jatrophihabitans endophyticus]SHF59354.1 Glycosyltransferase involved in cell wall bisynthesis [Jatrophihabitans endophyticus]